MNIEPLLKYGAVAIAVTVPTLLYRQYRRRIASDPKSLEPLKELEENPDWVKARANSKEWMRKSGIPSTPQPPVK